MATEHWAPRIEAPRELGVSLRTLDRMIESEQIEVRRCGRRVYVRIDGPKPPTDQEMLEKAREELAESESSKSALSSEIRQLKDELQSMSVQASTAEDKASQLKAEAARARSENQSLGRQLCEERHDRQHLIWGLIAMSVIAAMLFALHLL